MLILILMTFYIDFSNAVCYHRVTFGYRLMGDDAMYPVYPVPGRCPVCGESMTITRLHCPSCDVTIKGHFSLGRLSMLSPEQLVFVEVFLRCDGKIKRVERELGVSYPTVRSRLNEIISTMGYELPGSDDGVEDLTPEARRQVLDDLASGRITSDEAIELLRGELP
jgi:hypothetical protein